MKPAAQLLALERELGLGELGQRGGLLQEERVHPAEHAAHPLVQLGIGELGGQELRDGLGVVQLQPRRAPAPARPAALVVCGGDLLVADLDVLAGEAALELPVLLAALEAGADLGDPGILRRRAPAWPDK